MDMECADNGYAIYVNGELGRWYTDQIKAYSDFEFLRDILPDTETVDLMDCLTCEILATTLDWKHED